MEPPLDQQSAIEHTGCSELNEQLLLCYDEHRDWRSCQPEMSAFRRCYAQFQDAQRASKEKEAKRGSTDKK